MSDEPNTVSTQHLNDIRRRIVNGHPWTYDEVKEAIQALRAQRQEDAKKSSTSKGNGKKKGSKSTPVDLNDLLE